MRIIPAIDIIEGKCVRLSKGDYNTKKIYNEDPLEVAKEFESHGISYLHLVDLDGAKSKHIVNYKVLENLASNTNLKIDFGGGIKSDEDVEIAFNSGARQITGGSIAVKNPELFKSWLDRYGASAIILGADVHGKHIATHGWQETSEMHLFPFLTKYMHAGVEYVICTDISKDGMLQGPSHDLYKDILETNPSIKLVASGGITSMEDVLRLKMLGCEGAIIGKAIYESTIGMKELERFILNL
ncbi:MAG: 1-(5-phosphoribosyl)-5-[(5-phosphoribosylamino)methylideneamino]imidazole-4-carboxamide isomerase [Flavobacteriaceae bacterium]|nr:1-(5-phosphoribosyl)-5-[(5-phosphoribosylamino)methylideneamino]imidazole-4-carboxamide isomerase [Flavobacteriaceae bacterium]